MKDYYTRYFNSHKELIDIKESIPSEDRCSGLDRLIVKIHVNVLLNWLYVNGSKKNLSKEHERRCNEHTDD